MIRKFLILTALVTIPVVGISNTAKAHDVNYNQHNVEQRHNNTSSNENFWSVIFGSNSQPANHRHVVHEHDTHKKIVYKKRPNYKKHNGYYYHDDNQYDKKHNKKNYKKNVSYHPSHKDYRNDRRYR